VLKIYLCFMWWCCQWLRLPVLRTWKQIYMELPETCEQTGRWTWVDLRLVFKGQVYE